MGIRLFKAYTAGTRSRMVSDFADITKVKPEKKLSSFVHNAKGRNHRGVLIMSLKFYFVDFSIYVY